MLGSEYPDESWHSLIPWNHMDSLHNVERQESVNLPDEICLLHFDLNRHTLPSHNNLLVVMVASGLVPVHLQSVDQEQVQDPVHKIWY